MATQDSVILDKHGQPYRREVSFANVASKQRLTRDTDLPLSGFTAVVAPTEDADWKLRSFTEEQLNAMEYADVLKVLIDSSPDLARALNDYRMFINTQWTLGVLEEDANAERILQETIDTMRFDIGEPLSVKIDKLVASGYLKGAFYLETVFDNGQFVDIVINDPLRVRFVRDDSPERGQHWIRGEEHDGVFVVIDSDKVQYIPLNSVDGQPYGRSMMASGVNPIVSRLGMTKAARQSIESQAYPYQLATIDRKQLTDAGLSSTDGSLQQEVERVESDIRTQFENAQKSTQFVFGREVEVEIIGAMGRQNWDALEMLDKIYQPQITQGTMQQPVISGLTEGNALSTNADQQSEVWATQVDTFQTQIEYVMETCFTQVLREAGSGATPTFELKRNTSFVQKQRAERIREKTLSLSIWLKDGAITRQEYRDAIRNPEAFDNLSELLEPELPTELAALPMPGAPIAAPTDNGGGANGGSDDNDDDEGEEE